jgi:DNA-binding NarL/FixJ family response regulator
VDATATETSFCHPGCSYARIAHAGRPARCHDLLVKAGRGRPALSLSTIELERPEGRPPRQHLVLLGQGVPVKSVAARLGIRETTARNHVRAVLVELGAHSQLEAVATGRRLGLLA